MSLSLRVTPAFHPGTVVKIARALGVRFIKGRVAHLCYDGDAANPQKPVGRCRGVRLVDAAADRRYENLRPQHASAGAVPSDQHGGQELRADTVVVCAGAWTPTLVPSVADCMWPTAIIVFHFQPQPAQRPLYEGSVFPAYCADISKSGFYGFPAHPTDGRIKVGKHDKGYPLHGVEPTPAVIAALHAAIEAPEELKFREFLRENLPELAEAPKIFSRVCMVCDAMCLLRVRTRSTRCLNPRIAFSNVPLCSTSHMHTLHSTATRLTATF